MSKSPIKITQAQYDSFFTIDGWNVIDIPKEHWDKITGIQRLKDTLAIMGSASIDNPQRLNSINNIIAGIDVLTVENNPRNGELPGNAYHYVFQFVNDSDYPYIMYGPFKGDMRIPHSFDEKGLDKYS